jgi:soluble lytic murein transglycosylase
MTNITTQNHPLMIILCLILLNLISLPSIVFANKNTDSLTDPYKKQRAIFLKAEIALKKKQINTFQRYYKQLNHYPLQAYLHYQQYRQQLSTLTEAQVQQFIKDYQQTPYADWIQVAWLNKMAKEKKWQAYINTYIPQKSIRRQCYYLHALLKTGQQDKAFEGVPKLWLIGKSQHSRCDSVFRAFKKAGKMTPQLLLGRIKLAMKKVEPTWLIILLAHSISKINNGLMNG